MPLTGTWQQHEAHLNSWAPFHDFRFVVFSGETPVYLSVSGEPVFDAEGCFRGYRGTAHDVTREIATEAKVTMAETMLHVAAGLGRLGGWRVDLHDNSVHVTEELRDLLEYEGDLRFEFDNAMTFVAPEFRDEMMTAFQRCAQLGERYDKEIQVITSRGRRIWVRSIAMPKFDEQGRIVQVLGAAQDVTRHRTIADNLKKLVDRLSLTLESMTDGYYTLDDQWRFTYANQAAEKFLGKSRLKLLNLIIWDVFPEARGSVFHREFERAVTENRTVDFEACYQPLNVWVQVRAYPCESGLAVSFRNITNHINAESELKALNSELEERVRLRTLELELKGKELEEFAYTVAHDLRAPLTTIAGYSDALLVSHGQQLDPKSRSRLERIRTASGEMNQMTEALLELARISTVAVEKRVTELADMVRTIVSELHEAEPWRNFELGVEESVPGLADPILIKRVLTNLLSNAWKFTGPQTVARIEFGMELGAGDDLVYYVKDNGVGFDSNNSPHLFEMFRRLHSDTHFKGTGIGLAMSHKIVLRHGGRLWAESSPGAGAKFCFSLPTVSGQSPAPAIGSHHL